MTRLGGILNTLAESAVEVDSAIADIRVNKVLWSGSLFMGQDQSIAFSESAEEQTNGLVFVFSEYNESTGAAKNQAFWCRFIPKTTITAHRGAFFQFVEPTWNDANYVFAKGMWINLTGATGHTCSVYENAPYRSRQCVLRYVIGV